MFIQPAKKNVPFNIGLKEERDYVAYNNHSNHSNSKMNYTSIFVNGSQKTIGQFLMNAIS